jgi:glutaredoxin
MNKLKKYLLIFLLVISFLIFPQLVNAKQFEDKIYDIVGEKKSETVTIYFFHSDTCPHCKAEKKFLESIKKDYPNLVIRSYEVSSSTNYDYMKIAKDRMGSTSTGVPFTVIGDEFFNGYMASIGSRMKATLDSYYNDNTEVETPVLEEPKLEEKEEEPKLEEKEEPKKEENTEYDIPLLGKIDAKEASIPLIAIILGFIDGFNPCALWILLFLINMLFNMKNRKKMWLLGTTFLVTSAFVYFLAMLGLSVVLSFAAITWVRRIIALVAIIGGVLNLRSYLTAKEDGCHVVDEKKRKKYFTKIKALTAEQNLLIALIGIIALAASVNLVELACSAGFPTIFITILELNNIDGLMKIGYILIYILFFLIDDLAIFIIAMLTLKISGITTKYSKFAHLVGGIIMIIIGLLLIFKPEWIMLNF